MLIAAVALFAAAQAEPLDPDLACIVDRIPAATRAATIAEAMSGTGGQVRDAFRQATEACARDRAWAADYAAAAGRIAMALVLGEEAEAVLRQNEIPPDLIHNWFAAQSADVRQSEPSDEIGAALIEHLQAQGIPLARLEAQGTIIGIMLGALNMIERIGAGLE